jgi:hypothetical protein
LPQELTRNNPAPAALSIPESQMDDLKEAVAMNVGSGAMSEFDLARIKIASGTALWEVPTAKGSANVDRIEGVVVFMRNTRSYYKSKDAGSVPPNCSSVDLITGVGSPGGACAQCPHAAYDSATTADGKAAPGQACTEKKQLFMLRGDSFLPEVVSLPPTSLKAARRFFNWMIGQGIPHAKALIAITLERAENPNKKVYGRAVFDFVRRLEPEEVRRALMFRELCETFVGKVPAERGEPQQSVPQPQSDDHIPF